MSIIKMVYKTEGDSCKVKINTIFGRKSTLNTINQVRNSYRSF